MTHQTNTKNPVDFPQPTLNELLSGVWQMPPGTHQPENWLFMRCQDDELDYFRVLSCWHDDWRVSSEVQSVKRLSDCWLVTTKTSSEYYLVPGRNNPCQSAVNFANRVVQHWTKSSPEDFLYK